MSEPAVAWREGLVAELRALGAEFDGRVVATPPEGVDVVPAERFHDAVFVRQAIISSGESLLHAATDQSGGRMNMVASASRFTRHYVSSLTASAIVALARGVGLDLAADRCVKVVVKGLPLRHLLPESDDGIVTCAERPASWRVDGEVVATLDELRRHVWKRLYGQHLAPLFAVVGAETPATARLLWSNAAEWVAFTTETALAKLGLDEAQPYVDEMRALLDAPTLPGVDGPNPLNGLVEWTPVDEPDFPLGLHLRHHCCSTYMLPARTGYLCGNCPFLPVPERIALARENRERSGAGGGPAQQRSIEIGRRKLGLSKDPIG
jgi:ferric iron reductase protein FhuF